MVEKRIVEQCAPTLAGIKCGCLFKTECTDASLETEIAEVNSRIGSRGVTVTTFRPSCGGTLVYVYREKLLASVTSDGRTKSFLDECGYDTSSVSKLILSLREKIERGECLPHEIGVFLGYPLDDVIGFIKNNGKGWKCIGCWKVYSDIGRAEKLFEGIRSCRSAYKTLYSTGTPLTALTAPS